MIYGFDKYEPTDIIRGHMKMGGVYKNGESVFVNSRYIEINGKPWTGVMGEYHFCRDKSENWYDELMKMRACGIDIVATYLFWIYHEETEGEISFEGDLDIRKFVLDAKKAGLKTVLRIGPWAHGECRNGGFPDWLINKPWKLRQNDPDYLEKVESWYKAVADQVKDLTYGCGGNIIGIQLENELTDQAEHLLTLKKIAQKVGFDVPIFTVTGWNSAYGARIPIDEVIPVFGGYPEAPWTQHKNELEPSVHFTFNKMRNDSAIGADLSKGDPKDGWQLPYDRYPFATCELGGGIQVTRHRRPMIRPMDIYALALCKLGSGSNLMGYYMFHGGTNRIGKRTTLQESTRTGYPNDYAILDYDFQAPLSQFGQARGQYRLLNMLHMFLNAFGDRLALMETVLPKEPAKADDLNTLRYAMRTDGKSGFVFVNHYLRLKKLKDIKDVQICAQDVTFPKIDAEGEKAFILPFNLEVGNSVLEYATAQLLTKIDNTYFFAAIDGIEPIYKLKGGDEIRVRAGLKSAIELGGIKIITLKPIEALYTRVLGGKLYIGENVDLYLKDGQIRGICADRVSYHLWNGSEFTHAEQGLESECAKITISKISTIPFAPVYIQEMTSGKLDFYKICVNNSHGFVDIDVPCDYAQIYADGELIADRYYYGEKWSLPADLLYKRECYLVVSELTNDFYREFV